MSQDDVLILDSNQVSSILHGQELHLMELVRNAYVAHAHGDTSLPHSTFLTFPGKARERIIALPAFLGGDFQVGGLKWIASFPGNNQHGIDRASAVIVLNSLQTGRPEVIMEGAAISAKRTAASAVLAASVIKVAGPMTTASFIGCGLINREIARFLSVSEPNLKRFVLFDLNAQKAQRQCRELAKYWPNAEGIVVNDVQAAMRDADVISFATTAIEPHVDDLTVCKAGATILHVSLRDIAAHCALSCDNVADDIDHVCRARTTLHLAEQLHGSRDFIRCTLADVLMRAAPARASDRGLTVFSPFGLGILDLAVAHWVARRAAQRGTGVRVPLFAPPAVGSV